MKRSPVVTLAALCLAVSACGSEQSSSPPSERFAAEKVFSAEERRAARALSISNRTDLLDTSSPYMQAITCELAVETLAERMAEMRILTPAQTSAMTRVKRDLTRDIRQAAAREGKAPEDIKRDKALQREMISEPAMRVQVAMGCLRKLGAASPEI